MTDRFPHLAARAFGTPLCILPSKAEVILAGVVLPRLEGRPPGAVAGLPRPVAARAGDVAVVPVAGTLVHRAGAMEAMSGLQGYDGLRAMLRDARADTAVRGILLDMDSPGGEVAGLFDAADEVAAAAREKPVYAMIDEMACSAACLLSAMAERVFVTRTAVAGSVGVLAYHLDRSGAETRAGLVYTPVYAGARKVDLSPHAPLSDAGRAWLQGEVDKTRAMLVEAVARGRGVSAAKVRDTEGAAYSGADAVRAGLADEVGTADDAMAALRRRIGTGKRAARSAPSAASAPLPRIDHAAIYERRRLDAARLAPASGALAPAAVYAARARRTSAA